MATGQSDQDDSSVESPSSQAMLGSVNLEYQRYSIEVACGGGFRDWDVEGNGLKFHYRF